MTSLNQSERQRLGELEENIERNLQSAFEVGKSLREINDSKLYREEYRNFSEYCEQRWGMTKAYAYRLIEFSNCLETLSPIGGIQPLAEWQTRPLTRLAEREKQAVWNEAVARAGNRQPTGELVKEVAEEIYPLPTKEERFDIFDESNAVYEWLVSRRETWPENARGDFILMVRGCVERMESDDDVERRLGIDPAKAG